MITVDDDATISTRQVAAGADHWVANSTANSGNITLSAKVIEVGDGANLVADANNGFTAGNVSLTATANVNENWHFLTVSLFNVLEAKSSVEIGKDAHLKGNDISIQTTATSTKKALDDNTNGRDFAFQTHAVVMGDLNGDGRADL